MKTNLLKKYETSLALDMRIVSKHIREKGYGTEAEAEQARQRLLEMYFIQEELEGLIWNLELLHKALTRAVAGEPIMDGPHPSDYEPLTVWEYCVDFFEDTEFPLVVDKISDNLLMWIDGQARKNQAMSQLLRQLFPTVPMHVVVETENGDKVMAPATDEQLAEVQDVSFLRDIEHQNEVLSLFARFDTIHEFLQMKADPAIILKLIES